MAPDIAFEIGSPIGVAIICFASLLVLYIFHSSFFTVQHPEGVTLLRERSGKLTFSLKNRLSYFTDCESMYREAYHGVRVFETPPMCDKLTYLHSTAREAKQSSSQALVYVMR